MQSKAWSKLRRKWLWKRQMLLENISFFLKGMSSRNSVLWRKNRQMRKIHRMGSQVIVDPTAKDGRFHRRRPRLRQCFHPPIQIQACCGNRTFCVDPATHFLYTVADRSLVNIQSDVIHTLQGGSLPGVSESADPLSS